MFIINNKDLIYLQRNFCREIIIFWPKIGKYALNQRRELTGHVNQFCSSLYVKTRLKCCFCNAHCVLNGSFTKSRIFFGFKKRRFTCTSSTNFYVKWSLAHHKEPGENEHQTFLCFMCIRKLKMHRKSSQFIYSSVYS
jgi:hypothetical protein